MKRTILALGTACALFLGACNPKTDVKPASNSSYQPLTAGSTWTYKVSSGPNSQPSTMVNTMTSTTATYNGKTCYMMNSVDNSVSSPFYLNVDGHTYSMHEHDEIDGVDLDFTYLKDDANVNDTWTNNTVTFTPSPGETTPTAQLVAKLIEKGISKTIGGKTYQNVMHSQTILQFKDDAGHWQNILTTDLYIAQGIGIIGIYSTGYDGTVSNSELTSYTIK